MADCEKNVLEIPLNASLPNPDDVVIFTSPDGTSVLRKWSTVLGAIAPADIEFQVGVTPGAPSDGASSYSNPVLIGKRIRFFRQGIKQSTLSVGGGYSYSFNNVTGTVTPSPNFSQDEVIGIEIY